MNKEYYKILGIDSTASPEEIKKAYHRLAKIYHPDRNGGDKEAAEVFKEVNEAYHFLSDSQKRSNYISSSAADFDFKRPEYQPYFTVTSAVKEVKLNEEFEITFRFLGEGRIFKKPAVSTLFYNSSPVIHHRMIHVINGDAKETSMTFTLSATETGTITIPSASIYINHKLFETEQLIIFVTENNCYFKKGELAALKPYIFYLHKEYQSTSLYRRTYIYRHAVLIPRSNYAYYYHQVGTTLKAVFTILGLLYSIANNHSILGGLLIGSFCGGIACHSMYVITGMRSTFYYALKNETVVNYFEDSYRPGREIGYGIFDTKNFFLFWSLFR